MAAGVTRKGRARSRARAKAWAKAGAKARAKARGSTGKGFWKMREDGRIVTTKNVRRRTPNDAHRPRRGPDLRIRAGL